MVKVIPTPMYNPKNMTNGRSAKTILLITSIKFLHNTPPDKPSNFIWHIVYQK